MPSPIIISLVPAALDVLIIKLTAYTQHRTCDHVGHEEGQPADDEHPHHGPQRLGRLRLLGEPDRRHVISMLTVILWQGSIVLSK